MTANDKLRQKLKDSGLTRQEFVDSIAPLVIEKKLNLGLFDRWLYQDKPIPPNWAKHIGVE